MIENPISASLLYLSQLLEELGIGADQAGETAAFVIDDNLQIHTCIHDNGALQILAPLPTLGSEVSRTFLLRMLEANFLWSGTRGALFGLCDGMPMLYRVIRPGALTYAEFRQIIEQFVNTLQSWHLASSLAAAESALLPEAPAEETPSENPAFRIRV